MGGTVSCDSNIGEGTQFRIKLNTKCKKKLSTEIKSDEPITIIHKATSEAELTNILRVEESE